MAKVTGQSSDLSGKVGNLTYAQTKYGTVVYPSKRKAKIPRRSEKQMYIRTQWANLAAVYRQFNKTLKKAFEGLGDTMSVYNAFIQANTNVVKVYVPKSVRLNGGSVLAPYIITRGTLPSVVTTVNGSGVMVTDINLGNLVIGAQTTVQQLAAAVVSYNSDYQAGDQITFFYGQQTVDQVTGVPRAKITGYKVMLDLMDTTPLWDVVSSLGFTSVGGSGSGAGMRLGMSQGITDGACAWIHSREDASGNLNVSTQYLYVDSTVLSTYQGDNAFASSADSYGGINTEAVYLQPTDLTNQILAAAGLLIPEENENEDENGGSGSSSGTGGSSTGSETGGDSGSSSSGNGNENGGSGGSESTETGGGTSGETTGNETGDDNTGGSGSGSDNTGGGGDNTGGGGDDEPGGDDH